MYLLGYSLNNLSLMALTISTGFVVDDAIVMIENISRYIEEGERPLQAALKGFRTDRIHHCFADRLADRGADPAAVHGRYRGPAVPRIRGHAGVTILVSAVVSLTLTPMMCAKILKHKPESQQGWFYRASERGFDAVIAFYGKTLRWVLRYQTLTLLVAAATLVLTFVLFMKIPKGFFPIQDTGVIQGVSEAEQTISFRAMAERQQALGQSDFEGSGGGEPVVVHRHRRNQHHAEQRTHSD